MKKEGKIMCVGIVVIVLVVVAMITAKNNHGTQISGPDDIEVSDLVFREEIKDKEKNKLDSKDRMEKVISDYEKSLGNAWFITVEKVVRTTTEDTEGNYSTVYDSYLVSDVDLVKGKDSTEEFANAVSAAEYDDSLIQTVDFADGFGFSYQGLNARGIYEALLELEGFDGDLSKVTFDNETHEMTKQNIYVLLDEGSIIKRLLPEYESKDVIEQKVYFQTTKDGDIEVPECFVAVIKYREEDKVIEKSIYLQVSVNHWEVV